MTYRKLDKYPARPIRFLKWARRAFDYLRYAPSDALNSMYMRGPLAGFSGWDIMQIAEREGWGRWEGEYVSYN